MKIQKTKPEEVRKNEEKMLQMFKEEYLQLLHLLKTTGLNSKESNKQRAKLHKISQEYKEMQNKKSKKELLK